VYRIDPKTGAVALLDRGIRFTNGIAFWSRRFAVCERDDRRKHLPLFRQQTEFRRARASSSAMWFAPMRLLGGSAPTEWPSERTAIFMLRHSRQGDVTVLGRDGQVGTQDRNSGMLPTNLALRSLASTEYT